MHNVLTAARITVLAILISALAIPLIPSVDARAGELLLRLTACARRDSKRVALTFDDGPDPVHTSAVVKALRDQGVPATFFVTGNRLDSTDVSASVYSGFALGSHSYTHRRMRDAASGEQLDDLRRGARALELRVGERSEIYRPPRGQIRLSTLVLMRFAGYRPLGWSISYDRFMSIDDQHERITAFVESIRPGDVILMHDGSANAAFTSADLPEIILALQERGYLFYEAR